VKRVDFGEAMTNSVCIYQEKAVCLTKYGPYSYQTVEEILARKDFERRSGRFDHANEFWWGIGEKFAKAVCYLCETHSAKTVLFTPIKDLEQKARATAPSHIFVWRKYRTLRSNKLIDVPEHVLMTSADYSDYFALVCKSTDPIRAAKIGKFANHHYKNLRRKGAGFELGSSKRGQLTTASLVKCTDRPITAADCDATIEFAAQLCTPYCVQLLDWKRVPISTIRSLNQNIRAGLLTIDQWPLLLAEIRK
jgi:hypothetical protein